MKVHGTKIPTISLSTRYRPIHAYDNMTLRGPKANCYGRNHSKLPLLQLTVCVSDGRISNGRVNAFPMKDMLGQPRQTTQVDRSTDAPVSKTESISA